MAARRRTVARNGGWSYRGIAVALAALAVVYAAISLYGNAGQTMTSARADAPVEQPR